MPTRGTVAEEHPSIPGGSGAAVRRLHGRGGSACRVLSAENRAANPGVALTTNRRIGIAVGILMCRLRVTDDRALAVLSKHSQDHDVKTQRLAEDL